MAQQADPARRQQLDSVVVVSYSDVRKVEREAFSVTSIATKELKNTVGDAKEILNRVPGVRILEEGGLGSSYNLTLNGFSGQQVKVFLDGVPIDRYSSAYNLNNIPVNAIERMDVYKGVVPVTLGTDALGGVINIITNKQQKFLDASYAFGSFNTHRPSLNGAYTSAKTGFTVRGSANYNYSDNNYKVNVPIVRNNMIEGYEDVRRFHDRYRSGNLRVEAGVIDKKYADQLMLSLTAAADDKEVQTGTTMSKVYGGITTNSQTWAPTLRYSKKNLLVAGLDVTAFGSFNASKSQIADTIQGITYNWLGEATVVPGSNAAEFSRTLTTLTDREWSAGANAGYHITPKQALVVNYLYSHFERTVFDALNPQKPENNFPKALNKGVLSLGHNAEWFKGFSTSVFAKLYSIRASAEKQYDFALPTQRLELLQSAQTNLGYGLAATYFPRPDVQLKASYERAYRMPNSDEMFGDGLFTEANPELKPEWSHNINLGASYTKRLARQHSIALSASGLFRNATDLIYRIATISSPVTRYGNLKQTRTLGAEANASYWYKSQFHLAASATYQIITDQADFVYVNSYTNGGQQVNYQKGFRVPNIPVLFGNASAGYRFRNVLASNTLLDLRYRFNYVDAYFLTWSELGNKDSKRVIPEQASHDLELIYSFEGGRYNISAECRNLTDARLYDRFYLQKPGRTFFVKLRVSL
jgi:outer membrane receptor protein involved in Fe transport